MANVAVVGAQWGDEGKGKIVDWLSERADVVVRYQGGHNAGHTLVIDGVTYKLSLLPSGVVRPGKLSIVGNGVVVDPWALMSEIENLRKLGVDVTPKNLCIAENATLILPLHGELDRLREQSTGTTKIGTTGRGIGPAYEDKVARRAIRLADLAEPDALADKVRDLLYHHNALRRGMGAPEIDGKELEEKLKALAPQVLPFAGSVWRRLDEMRRAGRRILFEGAQGTMLDVDHGTYPYVTSSNTVAGQAAVGSGLGPSAIGFVLGITKAYTTRVGSGPFPTEQVNEVGQRLGERRRDLQLRGPSGHRDAGRGLLRSQCALPPVPRGWRQLGLPRCVDRRRVASVLHDERPPDAGRRRALLDVECARGARRGAGGGVERAVRLAARDGVGVEPDRGGCGVCARRSGLGRVLRGAPAGDRESALGAGGEPALRQVHAARWHRALRRCAGPLRPRLLRRRAHRRDHDGARLLGATDRGVARLARDPLGRGEPHPRRRLIRAARGVYARGWTFCVHPLAVSVTLPQVSCILGGVER